MTNYSLERLSSPAGRALPGIERVSYMAYSVDITESVISLYDDDHNLIINIDIDIIDEHFKFINSDTNATLYSN